MDENDKLCFYKNADKKVAHREGLLHKSVHLLITRDNKFLCRYRSKKELRYSGLYTTTIGVHVLNEADYLDTLKNFLPKGLMKLNLVGEFFVHDEYENEINGLYIATFDINNLPKDFLKDRKLFSFKELKELIKNKKATPHLVEAIKMLKV